MDRSNPPTAATLGPGGSSVLIILVVIALAPIAAAAPDKAGDFEIDWATFSSGGVEASGGDFDLLAEVGTPITGSPAGGDFEASTGFINEETATTNPGLIFEDGFETGDVCWWEENSWLPSKCPPR